MSYTESPSRSIKDNEILDEVYANREALAARFNYDVHELGNYFRERSKELEKQGVRFVSKEDLESQ